MKLRLIVKVNKTFTELFWMQSYFTNNLFLFNVCFKLYVKILDQHLLVLIKP